MNSYFTLSFSTESRNFWTLEGLMCNYKSQKVNDDKKYRLGVGQVIIYES